METIEQITEPFTGRTLQSTKTLLVELKANGRDLGPGVDEFLEYMDGLNLQERQQNQENQRKIEEYAKKAKKCPKCKSVMYCYEVNTTSRNQIGGDWKSQWICGNPDCGHEEFSIRSVDQEMRMLGLGG